MTPSDQGLESSPGGRAEGVGQQAGQEAVPGHPPVDSGGRDGGSSELPRELRVLRRKEGVEGNHQAGIPRPQRWPGQHAPEKSDVGGGSGFSRKKRASILDWLMCF